MPDINEMRHSTDNIADYMPDKLYNKFLRQCQQANVKPVSQAMFSRWRSGTAKRSLQGLPIGDIIRRHISYWSDKA